MLQYMALYVPGEQVYISFLFLFDRLCNNNRAKVKKLKPVPKQTVHRKQSTSKLLCISSDGISELPTTDTEEFGKEVKKNKSSKTELATASVHSVGRIKQEFGSIKIKVSNSHKKTSSTLSLGTSAQFQVIFCFNSIRYHVLAGQVTIFERQC